MLSYFALQVLKSRMSLILSLMFFGLFIITGRHPAPLIELNRRLRQWHIEHPIKNTALRNVLRATHYTGGVRIMTLQVILWGMVLFFVYEEKRSAIILTLVMLVQASMVNVLKLVYGFERPKAGLELMRSKSYPSGHSAAALTFAVLITISVGRLLPPTLGAIVSGLYALNFVLTAYARIALDVHWVSDVVGGLLFALGLLMGLDAVSVISLS